MGSRGGPYAEKAGRRGMRVDDLRGEVVEDREPALIGVVHSMGAGQDEEPREYLIDALDEDEDEDDDEYSSSSRFAILA